MESETEEAMQGSPMQPMATDLNLQDLAERLTTVRISKSKRHTGLHQLTTPASTIRPQGRRRLVEGDDEEGPDGEKENSPVAQEKALTPKRMNLVLEELSCSICLDLCSRPCTTSCGHNFCRSCLRESLRHNHRCPKCRKALPPKFDLNINTTLWNTIQLLFPAANSTAVTPPSATHAKPLSGLSLGPRVVSGLMRPSASADLSNLLPAPRPTQANPTRLDQLLLQIEQGTRQSARNNSQQPSVSSQRHVLPQVPASSFYSQAGPQLPNQGYPRARSQASIQHPVHSQQPQYHRTPSADARHAPLLVISASNTQLPDSSGVSLNPFIRRLRPISTRLRPDASQQQQPPAASIGTATFGPFGSPVRISANISQHAIHHSSIDRPRRAPAVQEASAVVEHVHAAPEDLPIHLLAALSQDPPSRSSPVGPAPRRVTAPCAAAPAPSFRPPSFMSTDTSRQQQRRHTTDHVGTVPMARRPPAAPVREHYLRPSFLSDTLEDQQDWPLHAQGRPAAAHDTDERPDMHDQQQYLDGPLGLPASRAERRRTRHSFSDPYLPVDEAGTARSPDAYKDASPAGGDDTPDSPAPLEDMYGLMQPTVFDMYGSRTGGLFSRPVDAEGQHPVPIRVHGVTDPEPSLNRDQQHSMGPSRGLSSLRGDLLAGLPEPVDLEEAPGAAVHGMMHEVWEDEDFDLRASYGELLHSVFCDTGVTEQPGKEPVEGLHAAVNSSSALMATTEAARSAATAREVDSLASSSGAAVCIVKLAASGSAVKPADAATSAPPLHGSAGNPIEIDSDDEDSAPMLQFNERAHHTSVDNRSPATHMTTSAAIASGKGTKTTAVGTRVSGLRRPAVTAVRQQPKFLRDQN